MAETALIINAKIATADTVTKLYDSPSGGSGTVISAVSVTNDSSASASYKIYIFDENQVVVGDPIVPQTIVVKDKSSPGATAVNQTIPPGGSLRAENSTANALGFYISGLEQA